MKTHGMRWGLTLGALFVCQAAGAATPPVQWLEGAVNQVLERVYDPEAADQSMLDRVRPLLHDHFNVDRITRGAVGFSWRQFSADEREQVAALFSEVVMRTYVDRFDPKERPEIHYGASRELPRGRREVATTLIYQGQKYTVIYRLESHGDGWRIYDVIAEGVSLVANYRAQFNSILQKDGVDGLIAALKKNLENLGGVE